jgi:long-chain acyl-CoA synthetase
MPTRDESLATLTASGTFELTTDESAGYPIRVYKNAPVSLREVFEATTTVHADRTFTVYGDETLTFAEVHAKAAILAHYLLAKGVTKGDRVAIGMRNYPEWIISFWACQAIGAVVVALNAWWITAELAFALEDSTPKVLLIDGERFERILPLLPALGELVVVVARRGGGPAGGVEFGQATSGLACELPRADIGSHDVATILYTSGITGRPKGAVATQRNHITNLMNALLAGQLARIARGTPEDFVAPQGGVLQTFPFFHIGGLGVLTHSAAIGTKMILMHKWNAVEAVDLVEKHGLTNTGGVPTVVRQFLEAAAGRGLNTLAGLGSGGAPLPPALFRRIGPQFEQRVSPTNAFGLTETTGAIITNSGADYFGHPDSVGRPTVTCQIKIVDSAGREVAQGEIGELWMRGANVIPGYWRNPEATEAAFGGGWFRSGDLGYVDADGMYYVVDRMKDVIIRGGENVYCAEVEAALLEHPLVRDAAVIGLPDVEYGEEVAAVIQVDPANQSPGLERELQSDLSAKLARFKIPTVFRITDDDLPRTGTGKVLKREIRAQFFPETVTATE